MHSALWLAGSSALLALTLYLLDAPYAAAIELSVGAGLVAVLFVLAVTTTHDESGTMHAPIPRWLSVALPVLCTGLVGWYLLPTVGLPTAPDPASFVQMFWQDRALDVFGQLTLLFVAALGAVVLMRRPAQAAETHREPPPPEARREELEAVREEAQVHA
jgi:NADH:ubiquinone oxidoreductase subunit 6 (subunit J)